MDGWVYRIYGHTLTAHLNVSVCLLYISLPTAYCLLSLSIFSSIVLYCADFLALPCPAPEKERHEPHNRWKTGPGGTELRDVVLVLASLARI